MKDPDDKAVAPGDPTETATFSELTELHLPYRQLVFNAERSGSFSLLLFLHGAGERGDDNARTKVNAVGRIAQYILDN